MEAFGGGGLSALCKHVSGCVCNERGMKEEVAGSIHVFSVAAGQVRAARGHLTGSWGPSRELASSRWTVPSSVTTTTRLALERTWIADTGTFKHDDIYTKFRM